VREGNSPSWFNPAEIVQVVRYLQAVLGHDTTTQLGHDTTTQVGHDTTTQVGHNTTTQLGHVTMTQLGNGRLLGGTTAIDRKDLLIIITFWVQMAI